MNTIILEAPGVLALRNDAEPERIKTGEALVRVRTIGVCGTDLHAFRGRQPFFSYPRILGHELGVEVEEVESNDRGIARGDRCAVEPYLNCGVCVACRKGKTNCCVNLKTLGVHVDGGMREWIVLPIDKLHKSVSLSLDQLALIETLGIGAHAVDRACLEPGENILTVGAGPIGLAVAQFALEAGARVIVVDVNADRLSFCRRSLGISDLILADASTDPLEAVRALTDGDLPTAVFDATGNAASMMKSFEYVSHGGRLVLVGLIQGEITFSDPFFHRREISILATRNSTSRDFTRIISLVESGRIDTNPWITHRARLEDVPSIFEDWLDPRSKVVKAMIET